MGQIWILANMPNRAQKLTRQKAASLSVVDSCMQLIEPKAPLALRLAAVLMRGVVQLYSRQLFFLSEDATAVLLNLKSHIVAPGMDKHVLEERRQQARPEQITRELDTYELMQLLDYGGGDSYEGALFAAASQGADSFFMVNPEDLRRLEAAERNAASHGAPSVHNRSSSRRRGADINLPDDDMLTGEDGVSGDGTSLSAGGHRSMFAPYDEEFEALPDDAEEDGFAAAPSVRAGSGAVGGGALVPIGEQEDDFYAPPPPDEEEFAPMPDEQAEVEALEDGKPKRKPAAKRQKKGILRGFTHKVDDAIRVSDEDFCVWLQDCSDIVLEAGRPKIGDAQVSLGRLGPRLDLAMQTPSMILLEPFEGLGKRSRQLCEPLAALFARHTKAQGRRRGASAASSPAASSDGALQPAEGDDVEAFRHDGSVDGAAVASPEGSLGGVSRGAGAGFGRRSGLSGGSGSLLAQALAGLSPKSGSGRAGRGSDAFGGSMRAGDLPGGGDDYFDVPYPDEEADAQDFGGLGGGFGGDGGGGLNAPFESLLETGPDGTQTQRDPKKALSGVSLGVVKYFTEAFGNTASQEAAITVEDLCANSRLNRTQRAQFFAQVLILASNSFIKVKQSAPYANIIISRGTAAMA